MSSPKLGWLKKASIYDGSAIIRIYKADPFKTAVDVVKEFHYQNMSSVCWSFWKMPKQKKSHIQEEPKGPIGICTFSYKLNNCRFGKDSLERRNQMQFAVKLWYSV